MQIERQERDWNELAQLDPYWAILTSPGKRYGRWDSAEFFATGKAEVDALMERASQLGLPQRRGRALADEFDECVGVDISENMVTGAREAHADVDGVSFVVNRASDLRRFADGSFDLVYSAIALQHVPDRHTIESYIAEFCRVLRPGGLAVFNLPSHIPAIYRLQWRRRLYLALRRLGVSASILYRRLHLVPIAMSYVPERDIVRLVDSNNARMVAVETQRASGLMNAGLRSSTYYVTR